MCVTEIETSERLLGGWGSWVGTEHGGSQVRKTIWFGSRRNSKLQATCTFPLAPTRIFSVSAL